MYAVALLATLLVAGSVSDAVGRRPVVLAALAVQSLSILAFLVADGLGWLFVARIGQGVATGLATAAVAAALIDHQPSTRPGLAGFGSTFLGAFRTLAAAASPARRGELIAALYVVAYLAFSLPAVVAGVLTTHVGLRDTSIGYATVVAALAIGSLTAARIRAHAALA